MFNYYTLQQVQALYSQDQSSRFDSIIQAFEKTFQQKPEYFGRAPGRVNIIGQHIDYQGYGVLPAAIQRDCLIAVKRNQNKVIKISHIDEKTYPSSQLSIFPSAEMNFKEEYIKYVSAGYQAGILNIPHDQLSGLDMLISGNIPIASGLSSSSALCVCSALVGYQANDVEDYPKEEFIQEVISCQRLVGTASGGMDQSISVLGEENSCLFIQFNPIKGTPINIPSGCKFILANSLVQSPKLNTAIYRYNKRVCECRIAAKLLAKCLNISQQKKTIKILKDVQQALNISLPRMSKLVDQFIQRKPYTHQEIQNYLGQTLQEILGDIQQWKAVCEANKQFKPYEAAKHVYEQADRVNYFIQICKSSLQDKQKNVILGNLMNESQDSCKNLYECSCPQLDQLTSLALKAGAIGSRLTGAGWGGFTVSLVPEQKVSNFIQTLVKQFYEKQNVKPIFQKAGKQNVIFATKPTKGACIIKL